MSSYPPVPSGLVLASASPRRSLLLKEAGFKFEVKEADVEEFADPDADPSALVHHNALLKARAVAPSCPEELVIGSDTTVFHRQKVLGKPEDLDEARSMLSALSGEAHQVYTAVAFIWISGGFEEVYVEKSEVRFKAFGAETIEKYIALVNPLDKAGSYGIQEGREMIIDSVEGSVANVMGLPIESLSRRLEKLGIKH